jgi:nucleoid-associated protein YgaU
MVRIISALILAVTAACASAAEPLKLVDNPPDRHIVVKGDTLWGISGKFLQQPWRWPEIWQMNKEQIKNPHWIYPGDIILLDMSSGSPRLKMAKRVGGKAWQGPTDGL